MSQNHPDKFARLRQQAEATLEAKPPDLNDYSHQQLKRLVYELRVHQIELELQNEELRRTQYERELAQDQYIDLYNSAPVGYVTLDDSHVMVEANHTAAQMLNQPQAKLIGQRLTAYVLPPDQDTYHLFHQELIKTDGVHHTRIRLVDLHDTRRYVLLEGQRVRRPNLAGTDKTWACHLVISDITTLVQTEQTYQTLVDNAIQGMLVLQGETVVFANNAVSKITGRPTAEIIDRPIGQILATDPPFHHHKDSPPQQVRPANAPNEQPTETRFTTHRGQERWLETYANPIEYQGKPAMLVVILDITERKRAEADRTRLLTEVIKQRGQLKALTARLAETQEAEQKALARELHDQVGQQLTSLNLNLNTLRARCLELTPPAPPPVLSLVDTSLQLVEETTERIQNVMANLRPPVLDDYGLLAALQWYLTELTPQVDFTIHLQGQDPSPRLPAAVELAMFRVVQEALTNIIKHSQASQVVIRLETMDNLVSLTIADNGAGFEPNDQPDLAKRTGWGLLTMAERIEAVGGHCLVLSQPGQGTLVVAEVSR